MTFPNPENSQVGPQDENTSREVAESPSDPEIVYQQGMNILNYLLRKGAIDTKEYIRRERELHTKRTRNT